MKAIAWTSAVFFIAGLATLTGCGGSSPTLPADFALTVSPHSASVPIGINSGTIQISIQPLNGFNQPVSVSLQGLPAGVSTVPASPIRVSPGTTQTVTISAARSASPGVTTISAQGNSGTLSHAGSFSISVATAAVYAYVAGNGVSSNPSGIAGYSVDLSAGGLTPVQGSPFNLTADPVTDIVVASESGGTFLYAVTSGAATTLLSFQINPSSGILTPIETLNYPLGFGEPRLAVHPSGKFLYAAQVANCVVAYSIDPMTGKLTQASCSFLGPNGPLVIAPSGKFAYGGDSRSTSAPILLTAYSVNQGDGSLTSFQLVATDQPNSLLYTDPQGHALYNLTDVYPGCGDISIWEIDPATGRLTSLNPSVGGPCTAWSMSFDPGSQFVYVAINIYRPFDGVYSAVVDPTTGNLTFVSGPAATGSAPLREAVVEPSQGRFLFVAGSNPSLAIVPYATDPSTGVISQIPGQAARLTLANSVRMVIVAPLH